MGQDVPGYARTSIVTRRNDKGARRSNSGNASSRSGSSSSSSGIAIIVAVTVAVIPAVAAAVAAAKQQRQQLQQMTIAATSSYQHHTSTSSISISVSSSYISCISISSCWCCWCFTGAGKINAYSKSTTRPRSGNGSCRSNSRMGKKVCQLLARFMPSYLSWILPSFLPSCWLRSRTQNQMGKRNRRIKRILTGEK